jgi:hypothetical protein
MSGFEEDLDNDTYFPLNIISPVQKPWNPPSIFLVHMNDPLCAGENNVLSPMNHTDEDRLQTCSVRWSTTSSGPCGFDSI